MDRDELIAHLAEILAGLQVPVSLRMNLGAAQAPLLILFDDAGFGWKSAETFEDYLRTQLGEVTPR
jgi:hypothetical protein